MTEPTGNPTVNRRQFLQATGSLAAGAAVLGGLSPTAFAGQDNTIRLALIGCGGRGTGAVGNALSVPNGGPIKLYAMADVVEDRMAESHDALKEKFGDKIDVPNDRKFIGFDAYQKAIDLLRPGDVAMCTTRAYIRPIHVEYAVKKGINVFMEKPFAPDPVACSGCCGRAKRPRRRASRSRPACSAAIRRPARR